MKIRLLPLFLGLVLAAISCKKDDPAPDPEPQPPAPTRTVSLQFKHIVDTSDLVFGALNYNPANQEYRVNKFIYYISNVVLIRTDNSSYVVPESYYLVDHANPASLKIDLSVPQSTYKAVSFMLGVDSARNTSGVQKGALDQGNKMFWTWNTGYIFLKLEGSSPSSGDPAKELTLHIGGFKGANKTQRTYSFNLGNDDPAPDKNITLGFVTNVNELFRTPQNTDFASTFHIMTAGSSANAIADNYADMFSYSGPVK